MLTFKQRLLAATIVAGFAAPASAQFIFPSTDLRGVGASAPADINVKVQNCIGQNQLLGNSNNTTSAVALADFVPTTPSTSNPTLTCSGAADGNENNIYNDPDNTTGNANGIGVLNSFYVSTGSGFGRQQWREFNNQFGGSVVNPFGSWSNVQYAFSEGPANISDLDDYNLDQDGAGADISTEAVAGKAIQIPLYVVPVAFAYNAQYGLKSGAPLNFRVKSPVSIGGSVAGGLRLSKTAYCAIWNGSITNWNDASLTTLNGGQQLRALADDQTRWDNEGVPIRLIGRADRSGTTDLFTRALAAQCGTTVPLGGTNKFEKAAESLPYFSGVGATIDIKALRSDTHYFPGSSQARFAGVTQSLNGYVYDRVTDQFCFWNEVIPAAGAVPSQCPATPAALIANAQTGSFTVADTSGGVEEGIRLATNNLSLTSATDATVTLNGKFGYIGADFVVASAGRTLHSAALQEGGTTKYLMPDAKNAALAFGAVLPPQTTLKSGAFDTADTRLVYKDLTNLAAGQEAVSRANPLHWVNVLYPPTGTTLANPTVGYPVAGASNILTYTCFSNVAKRSALTNFLGYVIGKATKKNDTAPISPGSLTLSNKLSANTFKGTGASTFGILAKSNIGLPSAGWLAAYSETFLKKSTQASGGTVLGDLNLYVHTKFPTKSTDIDNVDPFTDVVKPNPTCVGKTGA